MPHSVTGTSNRLEYIFNSLIIYVKINIFNQMYFAFKVHSIRISKLSSNKHSLVTHAQWAKSEIKRKQ